MAVRAVVRAVLDWRAVASGGFVSVLELVVVMAVGHCRFRFQVVVALGLASWTHPPGLAAAVLVVVAAAALCVRGIYALV